ncbi:rhodanese-like domain-containing protein [Pseudomonas sp. N040]|uniref:rhodanese-like domain-containing protein n=1 Tax=Pseudomonas sp. N040 TaxID=2785325 RepID=UPI0018A2FBB7|nr:rhodanese-like domain-containing protein [Pseudomonas sp. N040]MBF7730983.1 sulfurtransferase [Pseudomonas sp. N040]MBW7014626.1 sulfurtransferase [Pseudomonas sp. N040]
MSDFSNLPRIIEPEDLAARLEAPELILVDLGSLARYSERHIPGARHLDVMRTHRSNSPSPGLLPDKNELEQLFGELGHRPDAVYVAYDDDGGTAAGRFLWLLDVIGHPHWHFLNGSLAAWMETDRPLSSAVPETTSSRPQLTLRDGPTASREYLQEHLGAADLVVWDARSPAEYRGENLRAARGGHIPGAINLEWNSGIDPQRNQRVRLDIAQLLASQGITPDKEVITHCHTHRRSGFTYMLARALNYPRIRAYAGSWAEWGNQPDTPIES